MAENRFTQAGNEPVIAVADAGTSPDGTAAFQGLDDRYLAGPVYGETDRLVESGEQFSHIWQDSPSERSRRTGGLTDLEETHAEAICA
jgi:hypothetical protein